MHVNELRNRILRNMTNGFTKRLTMTADLSGRIDKTAALLIELRNKKRELDTLCDGRRQRDEAIRQQREAEILGDGPPVDDAACEAERERFYEQEDILTAAILEIQSNLEAIAFRLGANAIDGIHTHMFYLRSSSRRRRAPITVSME